MKKEIADVINGAKTQDWKKIKTDCGDDFPDIKVPTNCEILSMPSYPALLIRRLRLPRH
jgi:hypothetical protein